MAVYLNIRVVSVPLSFGLYVFAKSKSAISVIWGQGCSHLFPTKESKAIAWEIFLMIKRICDFTLGMYARRKPGKSGSNHAKTLSKVAA